MKTNSWASVPRLTAEIPARQTGESFPKDRLEGAKGERTENGNLGRTQTQALNAGTDFEVLHFQVRLPPNC